MWFLKQNLSRQNREETCHPFDSVDHRISEHDDGYIFVIQGINGFYDEVSFNLFAPPPMVYTIVRCGW